MDAFSFVFSLFGLLLGLALAEVLGGFGNVLSGAAQDPRVGWQAPLLGLLVALDLTSFWMVAWTLRALNFRRASWRCSLACCFADLLLVARLAFPKRLDEWPDLDVYYQRHKLLVLGGVTLCNVVAVSIQQLLGTHPFLMPIDWLTVAIFYPSLVAAMLVRNKRVSVALLAFLCLQYVVLPVLAQVSGQFHLT